MKWGWRKKSAEQLARLTLVRGAIVTKSQWAKEVTLWVIAILLALVCLRSGLMKMPGIPGEEFWARDFARWGYAGWFQMIVGIVELVSFGLLLVPRWAGYGGALFGLVMAGAIFTHAMNGETGRLPLNIFLLALSIIVIFTRKPAFLRKIGRSGSS